jgi:phosphate transport system substrate-binding protein
MKKHLCLCMLAFAFAATALPAALAFAAGSFDASQEIAVVSREAGSGTRSAFVELFGILQKTPNGKKDLSTKEAVIAKQTDVMMATVAGNPAAIGYISLGSLNPTVKALAIDGIAPSAQNVENGSYPVTRPFYVATKGEPQGLARDFLDFILSAEGQAVVAKHCIPADPHAPGYRRRPVSGKLVIAGSSSVTPAMEKLKEAYLALHPEAAIEIQQSDSSAGLAAAIEGMADIAMASRELKGKEQSSLIAVRIAIDGIAVVANNANPASNLSKAQVRAIFTGQAARWRDVPEAK